MQVIEFYAEFAKLTGSIPAAVFLTHALRCQRRFGGWFSKTIAEWEKATTLSREQQDSARQKLLALGVLREERKGLPAKIWYWVDEECLNQMLNGLKAENPETHSEGKPQTRLRKKHKQDCGKATNKIAEKTQTRLRESHKQDCGKPANLTTTDLDTNNINIIDHTSNVISCNRDYVDHVVESSSFLQDSSFYKDELCLLNTHAEQSSAVCAGQDQTFCEDDGKERKQTELTAGSHTEAHDKKDDAIGTSTPATHSLTVDFTTAKTGGGAETEGSGALNPENAQESFIGDFLVRDIPNIVTEQENAPERLETALKRKSSDADKAENGRAAEIVSSEGGNQEPEARSEKVEARSEKVEVGSQNDESEARRQKSGGSRKRQKTKTSEETPEEREFREGFYDFAKKAIDWIVSKGGVREEPSRFWAWAKRLNQRDTRITPDTLTQCFCHYVANTNGTWWRSKTKTFKQFVSAFEDIYQSYQQNQQSYPHVQFNQLNQKGDSHELYSANYGTSERAKYWQQWLQTAYQSGLSKF